MPNFVIQSTMNLSQYITQKNPRKQRGISLIEVLISIIVMTFGLLGISGLMMAGVNNSTGSDLASRANQSASEIMDAMRANRGNALNYVTDFGADPTTITGTTPADTDRKQWLETLALLPGGGGEIKVISGNTFSVKIRFSNCIGTLSSVEKAACVAGSGEKRTIPFIFQI
jgi:type IV pilus assembly protein PilV